MCHIRMTVSQHQLAMFKQLTSMKGQDPSFFLSHPFINPQQLLFILDKQRIFFLISLSVMLCQPRQIIFLLDQVPSAMQATVCLQVSITFYPMPLFQQSIGGQPYPGQQVNTSPHHLSNSGVADQSEGAVVTGVH